MSRPLRARFSRDNSKYGKRHKPGEMNQTESVYAEMLQARKLAGEVIDWQFEALKFRLADLCFYTPDFSVFLSDGTFEFVDAKGGGPMDDKSIVKVKVAAERFPYFRFVIEKRLPRKLG
jgi:hypothetical protein